MYMVRKILICIFIPCYESLFRRHIYTTQTQLPPINMKNEQQQREKKKKKKKCSNPTLTKLKPPFP